MRYQPLFVSVLVLLILTACNYTDSPPETSPTINGRIEGWSAGTGHTIGYTVPLAGGGSTRIDTTLSAAGDFSLPLNVPQNAQLPRFRPHAECDPFSGDYLLIRELAIRTPGHSAYGSAVLMMDAASSPDGNSRHYMLMHSAGAHSIKGECTIVLNGDLVTHQLVDLNLEDGWNLVYSYDAPDANETPTTFWRSSPSRNVRGAEWILPF